MPDPISTFYDHMWDAALAVPELAALVLPGNRIRFDSATDREPLKEAVTASDCPELVLVPNVISWGNGDNSSTTRISITMIWVVTTGDLRVSYHIAPVLWQLYRAMFLFQRGLGNYQYNAAQYIESLDSISTNTAYLDATENRGIKGWSASMSINATLLLPIGAT